MRAQILLVFCLLLVSTLAQDVINTVDGENEVDSENEVESENEVDTSEPVDPVDAPADQGDEEDVYDPKEDPCFGHDCPLGKECDVNEHGKPHCVCISTCPQDTADTAKVCSTHNITFVNECELHRQRCMCHHDRPECDDAKFKHVKLDYYGPCKEQTECTESEMLDFPVRMRDWFYHVMEELGRRNDLPKGVKEMQQENEKHTKKWVIPVIWKFCDLDLTLHRHLTHKDLLPMTAPLKTLEHCTGPFLDHCDVDDDEEITLKEWGHCLGLEDGEIEDRCDEIRQ